MAEQGHVLVVDDLTITRELLSHVLRDAGFSVRTAASGAEALERVRERRPSVIVLDWQMPVMGGAELATELQRRGVDIPIIVMTASNDAQTSAEGIGAAAWTSKPVDWKWLVATITELCGGAETV